MKKKETKIFHREGAKDAKKELMDEFLRVLSAFFAVESPPVFFQNSKFKISF
jgi:hypothetical protein